MSLAIIHKGPGTTNFTSQTTLGLVLNGTPTAGNVIIATMAVTAGATVTPPAGTWTQYVSRDTAHAGCRSFWHIAVGGETATYTFTSASQTWSGYIYEIGPEDPTTPINQSLDSAPASTSPTATPSVTPSVIGCLALSFLEYRVGSGTSTTGVSTGWTLDNASSATQRIAAASQNALTVDTVTAITNSFTWTGTPGELVAFTVLIAPTPSGVVVNSNFLSFM